MLTWAASWWLAGLGAAVTAPVAAHLLSRRGGVLAGFPAVRFLEKAVADVARVERPRHWLLLLLRVLALCLVVLAFAEPRWLTAAAVDGDAGVRVGIVVDRSASMQRAAGGETLFDEARHGAVAMLRSLDPARDRAAVVLADAAPRSMLAEPSANFTHLAAELTAAAPTWQRGDLELALDLAAHTLQSSGDAGPMRLEIFTDAQRTVFPAAAVERWRAQGVTVTVHAVGQTQPNLAVQDVRVVPAQPVAGQPALLRAKVRSFDDQPRTVTLHCGAQSQRVAVPPYREVDAVFEVTFEQPGETPVGVTLDFADALDADHTAGRVVDVVPARPVVLVTRGDTMDTGGAAYYAFRGLSPSSDGRAEGVTVRVMQPDQLATQPPAPGAVWVLIEAAALDTATLTAMTRQVEAGGGVLWVVDSADAAHSAGGWDASPIVQMRWMAGGSPAALAVGRFDDPVLGVFEGPGRSTLLDHTFASYAAGVPAAQASGLLLASDGAPLLATAWRGSGRAAVLAADLSPASTGLAKQPAWPALLHQLVRHLAPGAPPDAPLRPGDTLPDGSTAQNTGRIDTPLGPAWVELHPDESDLRVAETLTQNATATAATSPTTQLRPAEFELWPWFMLVGLVLLACETAATWWFDASGSSLNNDLPGVSHV